MTQETNQPCTDKFIIFVALLLLLCIACASIGYCVGKSGIEETYKQKLKEARLEHREEMTETVRRVYIEAANRGYGKWQIRHGHIHFEWKEAEIDKP